LPEVAAQTILLRPNNAAGLERVVLDLGPQIAAFIIEPVGTNFGVIPVSAAFLRQVQSAARSTGAVFILDEVLSGFRVAPGGAQSVYGLQPDLTTLAKILCGGMPGGAVAGNANIMDLLDCDDSRRCGHPKVLHQGTFTANPVSMAAGIAVLREIERTAACSCVNRLGQLARNSLNEMAAAERLPFCWYGEFSAFHMRFGRMDDEPSLLGSSVEALLSQPRLLANRFRMAINVLGADINTRGSGLLCALHTEEEIARYVDAVAAAGCLLRRDNLI
jgi:glutamate-1-semialdehyde 2,1-aminomutase